MNVTRRMSDRRLTLSLRSLDSWKCDFQNILTLIDTSNLDYKNAAVNKAVFS